MADPVEEFIGQQLHSISDMDAGMLPKRAKGKRSIPWWPYQHHKSTKSFNTGSHEDRLIGAIDKKRRRRYRSRQDVVEELLEKNYKQTEIAEKLGVSRYTVMRDIKKLRGRLKLCLDNEKK